MNCRQVANILCEGTRLPLEAQEHLRACRSCAQLAGLGDLLDAAGVDPAVEDRIIKTITTDMAAVDPVGPMWRHALAISVAAIAVAGVGMQTLGSAGWDADSSLQRGYWTALLAVGLLASAIAAARLMTPGSLLLATPGRTIQLSIVGIAAGALLYPPGHYDHFLRAAGACLSIGLGHAAVTCALTFLVVRRGAFVWRPEMMSILALLGGLTGLVVLYVFCPHRDLGHFSLGHTTVPISATALGIWIGRRATR
jgi:hypothetical protein